MPDALKLLLKKLLLMPLPQNVLIHGNEVLMLHTKLEVIQEHTFCCFQEHLLAKSHIRVIR
jgi:hypothetical protein